MQLLFSIAVGGLFFFYKPLKIKVSLTFAGETSSDFDPSFPCQVFNLNNLVEQIICAKENKIFFTIFINRPRYSTLRQHTNHMNEVFMYSRLEASCDLQHEKN